MTKRNTIPGILFVCLPFMATACYEGETTIHPTGAGTSCTPQDCDPAFCGDVCADFLSIDNDENNGNTNLFDLDSDTIPDKLDNCPDIPNPGQDDSDGDGFGDACPEDADTDGDTVLDSSDNCRYVKNPDQKDTDHNGVGDACAGNTTVVLDLDNDTIPDGSDNCRRVYNPDQADSNGNGIGDVCEPSDTRDIDGDRVPDSSDNCPDTFNPDQADSNNDGIGDACTAPTISDRDGDTVADDQDNCPDAFNPDQTNVCSSAHPEEQDGSINHPFIVNTVCGQVYRDSRDTTESSSRLIDVYPEEKGLDESGPEYFYKVIVDKASQLNVFLDAEPSNVDIDVHLLKSVSNISGKTVPASDFIARANTSISHEVQPGEYWVVADTYTKNGTQLAGKYTINISLTTNNTGTVEDPFQLNCGNPVAIPSNYIDQRSTTNSQSKVLNKYPNFENTDESGAEYVYKFTVNEKSRFRAHLRAPEPDGVDIDLHLLSSLNPMKLIQRDDKTIWEIIEPGTYYLVADTFSTRTGDYILDIQFRPVAVQGDIMFNDYILKAVAQIDKTWKKRGYGPSAYTHDLPYGSDKVAKGPRAPLTMCVAATAEVILTAMDIYASETGDTTVWEHLPYTSWTRQNNLNIKGHIWCDPKYSCGTGDAVSNFGMGMNVTFEELVPGSFIGLNRTSGSGHSTTFLAFLDKNCKEYETWNSNVVGFKYYSSQGSATNGGFDYRYAVFSGKTMTCESGKKVDKNVIYPNRGSNVKNALYLNTGVMYHPRYWLKTSLVQGITGSSAPVASYFNEKVFNGLTDEDE